mmetsp:Transcript_4085/g.9464  ORF Transcript_4085/g.9464 Transcript_4085/m.9464 type:complete len:205 (+) Transcript_4085:1298-1912(+)
MGLETFRHRLKLKKVRPMILEVGHNLQSHRLKTMDNVLLLLMGVAIQWRQWSSDHSKARIRHQNKLLTKTRMASEALRVLNPHQNQLRPVKILMNSELSRVLVLQQKQKNLLTKMRMALGVSRVLVPQQNKLRVKIWTDSEASKAPLQRRKRLVTKMRMTLGLLRAQVLLQKRLVVKWRMTLEISILLQLQQHFHPRLPMVAME